MNKEFVSSALNPKPDELVQLSYFETKTQLLELFITCTWSNSSIYGISLFNNTLIQLKSKLFLKYVCTIDTHGFFFCEAIQKFKHTHTGILTQNIFI